MNKTHLILPVALSSLALVGCGSGSGSDSKDTTTPPVEKTYTEKSVDSSTGAQTKFNLSTGEMGTDSNWHVSYQKYVGFATNGGVNANATADSQGGKVTGCIAHKYDALFDEKGNPVVAEFEKLTQANTQADFEAVTKASCNDADYSADYLYTQIAGSDWYAYNFATHTVTAKPGNEFLVRHANGTDVSRFSVTSITENTKFVIKTETWDDNAKQYKAAQTSAEFTPGAAAYFDFDTNALVTENDGWDLKIIASGRTYSIQTNGGISGSGKGGSAILTAGQTPSSINNPLTRGEGGDVYRYTTDKAKGVMSAPGNYGALQYGVGGGHKMWPTFATYILKDEVAEGTYEYFKVQVISNYGVDETKPSANIVYRFEKLDK